MLIRHDVPISSELRLSFLYSGANRTSALLVPMSISIVMNCTTNSNVASKP